MEKEKKEKKKTSLYKAFIPFATLSSKVHEEWRKEGHEERYNTINSIISTLTIAPIVIYSGTSIMMGSLNYAKWGEIASKRNEIEKVTIEKIAEQDFRKYDLDGDNFLSQEEFKNYNYYITKKIKGIRTD